jgi:histidyl-tRNA synthetase
LGFDRILMARRPSDKGPGAVDVYVVAIGEAAQPEALRLCTALRRAGIGADLDLMGRSMKGQMKDADRSGARWAAILGEEEMAAREATLRDLESGEQKRVPLDQVVQRVSES